jgi:anti-sigma regulatory factor (Ser/Thr protein kinase)
VKPPERRIYTIRINRDCYGSNPTEDAVPATPDGTVRIDLSQVDLFRPSGLAFVFLLAFTMQNRGADVQIVQPAYGIRLDYLRRTNFFNVLVQQGLKIPQGRGPLDRGSSSGLIKPSIVKTTDTTAENVRASLLLYDRFRTALQHLHIEGHDRAASVFSELSLNAAEHSRSPNGAFIMAQAYPERHAIELAVADVGCGIRRALGEERYATDAEAILAALQEEITGRRDAAGQLAAGGYGLPTVAEEADVLEIRSGDALLRSGSERNERGELLLTPEKVARLDGTLVIATVSTNKR